MKKACHTQLTLKKKIKAKIIYMMLRKGEVLSYSTDKILNLYLQNKINMLVTRALYFRLKIQIDQVVSSLVD